MKKIIGNYQIEIVQDEFIENPRTHECNVTKMVCFHASYNLGDEKHGYNQNDYSSWDELKQAILENENVHTIEPLYLYDHSGITISTKPFSCRFDSRQIGFVYVTKQMIDKEQLDDAMVQSFINEEVKTYDAVLRGDVWGYTITEIDTLTQIDECFGFYDEDECIEEAEQCVQQLIESDVVKQVTGFTY